MLTPRKVFRRLRHYYNRRREGLDRRSAHASAFKYCIYPQELNVVERRLVPYADLKDVDDRYRIEKDVS